MLRHFFSGLLVLIFATVCLPFFFFYSFTQTFFKTEFYSETITERSYNFLIDNIIHHIYQENFSLKNHIQEKDLKVAFQENLSQETFKTMMLEFGQQMQEFARNRDQTVVLPLRNIRESFNTTTQKLSYDFLKTLPICNENKIPQISDEGLPDCVPDDLNPEIVMPALEQSKVITENLIPNEIRMNMPAGNSLSAILNQSHQLKTVLPLIIILILVIQAILNYQFVFQLIRYEGLTILLGSLSGFFISYLIQLLPSYLLQNYVPHPDNLSTFFSKPDLEAFLQYIFSPASSLIGQFSMIFFGIGSLLFLISFILPSIFSRKKSPQESL